MKWYSTLLDKTLGLSVEILLALPLLLTVNLAWFDFIPPGLWFGIHIFTYAIGLLIRRLFIKHRRWIPILIGVLFAFALGFYLGRGLIDDVILSLLFFFVYIRGMVVAEVPWSEIFPKPLYLVGLMTYFVATFFYGRIVELRPFLMWLTLTGIAATALCLFTINADVLRSAAQRDLKDTSSRPTIHRHNRRLTIGVFLIILILTAYRPLKDGLTALLTNIGAWLMRMISALFAALYKPITGEPPPPEVEGGMPMLPPVEEKAPSIFGEWIVRIVGYILLTAAAIALAYLLLRTLWKLTVFIIRLLKKLLSGLSHIDTYDGYQDEKESLMNWQALRKTTGKRLLSWMERLLAREPKWEDLKDDRQRARFLYRQFMIKCIREGYPYKRYLTPQETASELSLDFHKDEIMSGQLAKVYQKARYGNEEMQPEELLQLRQWMEKTKG